MNDRTSAVTNFAVRGLVYKASHHASGKFKIGRFVAVDVFIANNLVFVTEHSRYEPSVRHELGPVGELTIATRKQLVMCGVTLVGNGNTCAITLNAAAASALQAAVVGRASEPRTSHGALLVA